LGTDGSYRNKNEIKQNKRKVHTKTSSINPQHDILPKNNTPHTHTYSVATLNSIPSLPYTKLQVFKHLPPKNHIFHPVKNPPLSPLTP
jgi:hypothetical protein